MNPPRATKLATVLTKHGDSRTDHYYWLRHREDPQVLTYLQAENDYTEHVMGPHQHLREELFAEMIGRIKKTDMSAPYRLRGYTYFTRYTEKDEYPRYYRRRDDDPEQLMLDVNQLAEPHDYYHATGLRVSPNDMILAFAEDSLSRRIYNLRFSDLSSGTFLEDVIPNTTGQTAWANDNSSIFYVRRDEALRPYQVYRHLLGTDPNDDVLIYHEEDDTYRVSIQRSRTGKYIFVRCDSTYSTEYRLIHADHPDRTPEIFQIREEQHEYSLDHEDAGFVILTNWQAENFRLMKASESCRHKKDWQPFLKHEPSVLLDDFHCFKDYLVLRERKEGQARIRVLDRAGKSTYLSFEEATYDVDFEVNREYHSDHLRLHYTSLITPNTILEYNMLDGSRKIIKQQEVLGEYDPALYTTERMMIESHDGVEVPLSIVYRKDRAVEGGGPLVLYGYGAYGISIDPYFSSARLSLLDRGFAFAIAHIRGGEDLGRYWYEDGKYLKKKNTFLDFIACGNYLVKHGYTASDQMMAMGGSAGGLLIGAVINMAPALFRAVIAAVPFVDVLTTMLDESIPLTTGEYTEWGNPNEPSYYDYIKSYSPYDNVSDHPYPEILVTTGLHDSQVQYWEPAKWVAKLRDHSTTDSRILLHTDLDTGHGGASGRFKRFHETALHYAFFLTALQ